MPGFKRPPIAPGSLCDLVSALHKLHLAAGYPSTRELQRDIGGPGVLSHTSIHKIFTEPRLPRWPLVDLVVEAMARRARLDEKAEVERFKALWDQAALLYSKTTVSSVIVSPPTATGVLENQETPGSLARSFSELLPSALDEIEAIATPGGKWPTDLPRRIPTGFSDLDALLGGWTPGSLVIIGGRPSSGKTTLLLDFCRTAAIKYAIPSMLITGEMNSVELQSRILSAEARVPLHSMRTGQMGEEDWTRLARRMAAIVNCPIHIGTPSRFQITQLEADATRLARQSGLELLLIDSFEWITAHLDSHGSTPEASLWALKDLAVTLKIPIIVSAQAGRHKERFSNCNPIQYLDNSNAIERVADIIVILNRPDQDDREHPRAGEVDLVVAKNRNGPAATVTVTQQYYYCRLLDMWPQDNYTPPNFHPEQLPEGFGLIEPGDLIQSEPDALVESTDDADLSVQRRESDRRLCQRVLGQMVSAERVMDWLQNDFSPDAVPSEKFKEIEQIAELLRQQSIDFVDKDVAERYVDLRNAVYDFCKKISNYTCDNQAGKLLATSSVSGSIGSGKYSRVVTLVGFSRDALVKAYTDFLSICHERNVDREAGWESA